MVLLDAMPTDNKNVVLKQRETAPKTLFFGYIEVHATVDSTQSILVREGGQDGQVIVADHQTAGRGRAGRSWMDVKRRVGFSPRTMSYHG